MPGRLAGPSTAKPRQDELGIEPHRSVTQTAGGSCLVSSDLATGRPTGQCLTPIDYDVHDPNQRVQCVDVRGALIGHPASGGHQRF